MKILSEFCDTLFTARKRSRWKVILLHLSVILFTMGVSVRGGVSLWGRVSVRETPTMYDKERAVGILLECFLVVCTFYFICILEI